MASELIPCKERDYLEQDPEIRGQKYVCLSFLSPEDVIRKKDVFFFNKFLGAFSTDVGEFFENTSQKFKDDPVIQDMIKSLKERYDYIFNVDSLDNEYEFFKRSNISKLEEEYLQMNNFQTTMRGIKVRGVYDTLAEATGRASKIKSFDKAFHVYVAEVGCWCPWSPYPDEIKDQEFAETQLNTLMKKYQEGQELKDELYRLRKNDMVNKVTMHPEKAAAAGEAESSASSDADALEKKDPWMERKDASSSAN